MPVKIACLDSSTLDRQDLDFSALEALGELTLHEQTGPETRIERCRDAEIVITNKVVLDASVFEACPRLRYVVIAATGTNNVDLDAAARAGVPVSNVAHYSTPSVAQHVLGFVLSFATQQHRYTSKPAAWAHSPIFTRLDYPIAELGGKTFGIVGLGAIGARVAELVQAFEMHPVALDRKGASPSGGVPRLPRDEFFASSDFVSLHCPLTEETRHLVDADVLDEMKSTAFLINTGRGPLVDETALLEALREESIAGAAVDVLSVEPPPTDHPLLAAAAELPNLLLTPHTAWASREARGRLLDTVVRHISTFLDSGEAPSRVG